jgi:hypothetical protein
MKRIKSLIIILFSFAFFCGSVKAQISAQVSSKRVQVGVPFEYAVVIAGSAGNYTQPNLKDFDIVSGPNQSSSIQYVNGVVSQQMVFSYGLVARREGKFTIPPASCIIGGQRVESAPIVIEAAKGAASQAQDSDDPQYNSKVSGGDVFIRTGISKNKLYLGEQVTITQKVYSRYQIIGFQKLSQPTYDGFYSQAQESASKGVPAMENVDGINYYTYELFRTIATANKAGKITLTPIEGDVVVRRQTNAKPKTIFEQFFGAPSYEDMPVTTRSKPMNIEVLPLPEAGKPENFNGAVGNFSSKVEVSRNELKANEAFNLKWTITGRGNLKLINAPALNLPDGFETYEPKTAENGNSKTFDYLVIPRQQGDYELKNFEFSYFDLDSKKYVTLPSPEIKIKVLAPDPNSAGLQVYTPQSQIKETENDIRYIKKGDFLLSRTETEFFNSFTHLFLLALPALALIVGLILRRNQIKNNSNLVLVRERKAAKIAKKQLQSAEKLMLANKKDDFYTEILTALNRYLSYKLNIPVADLSRETINSALEHKQIDEMTLSKLISTIDTSEYAKYAPGAVSGDLQTVYKNTVELIAGLDQQLNKKAA